MCGPLCARGTVTACKEAAAAAATRFKMITLLCSNKIIFICLASNFVVLRGSAVTWRNSLGLSIARIALLALFIGGCASRVVV